MNLNHLTREEIEAETRAAAIEDRVPRFDTPRPVGAAAEEVVDATLFSVADLWSAQIKGVPFTIPGTSKRVFIHPVTSDDYELMLRWSLADEVPDPANVGANPRKQAVDNHFLTQRMREYQVILCCKSGPGPDAKRIFGRQDAAGLRTRMPYATIVRICDLSDELTGNEETLGAGVRGFFTRIASYLLICAGKCGTADGSPSGLPGTLKQLASVVSRASMAGTWASGLNDELDGLLNAE